MEKVDIKNILKKIPLLIAILLTLYLIFCYTVVDFVFVIFLAFFVMIVLNLIMYYMLNNPIDYKERGPSFIYVFFKVSYVVLFSIMIIMILANVLSKKNILQKDEKFHYMIVFGAGVNEDDRKNNVINKRIEKAIEYAKKDKSIKFVLSGSKGKNDLIQEAQYMLDYMTKNGVQEDKILLDPFSNNTFQNIENSLYVIQQDILKRNRYENFITRPFDTNKKKFDLDLINIGFISSDFHIWRINLMAMKKGIKKPYDVIVDTNPLFYLYYYIRENLSIFKAMVLGQL